MLPKCLVESRLQAEEHVGQETSPSAGGRAPQSIYLSCTPKHALPFHHSCLFQPESSQKLKANPFSWCFPTTTSVPLAAPAASQAVLH